MFEFSTEIQHSQRGRFFERKKVQLDCIANSKIKEVAANIFGSVDIMSVP